MEYILLLLSFILLVIVTRQITVFIHELGHAIPAIILTGQSVSIYIGSYGDPLKSFHFKIGLLEIWFKYNPVLWNYGLCVPSAKSISINKQIIYTLTGPIASITIAVIACYFTFEHDLHGFLKVIFTIFLGSAIFDLLENLTPNNKPITLYDGTVTYNDGYTLMQLYKFKKLPKKYLLAFELYNQQKFDEAAVILNDLLKSGMNNDDIYRLAISSFLQVKNLKKAIALSDEFSLKGKLNSRDFGNVATAYSQLGEYEKALELYDKCLELDPLNMYALNNKGFTLNLLYRYEDAIALFDRAIEVDKTFAYSYNNRGLAKIKIGNHEEGLEDINHSLKLDADNAYAYRNLGIYHLDKGENLIALELFSKAKHIDQLTHNIDELINEAQKQS